MPIPKEYRHGFKDQAVRYAPEEIGPDGSTKQAWKHLGIGVSVYVEITGGVPPMGDDAGHFEGNFDLVAVMDFADFDSARLYVQHPLHQAYVRDHAAKVVGERVIVQHEWNPPPS